MQEELHGFSFPLTIQLHIIQVDPVTKAHTRLVPCLKTNLEMPLLSIFTQSSCPFCLTAEVAWSLYSSLGFPVDLIDLMLEEKGISLDSAGFNKLVLEDAKVRGKPVLSE